MRDLRERVQFMVAGVPEAVLNAAVPGLAWDLARILDQAAQDGAPLDVEAVQVLVALHWCRYQLLSGGQELVDLQAFQTWSGELQQMASAATSRGIALVTEYEHTGHMQSLEAAIDQFRQVVAAIPLDHPGRPAWLSNLGGALQMRYRQAGQPPDLDEAITVLREAVADASTDDPDRCTMLSNLAIALGARFEQSGQLADVDEAITVWREAVAGTPTDYPTRRARLSNLGIALQARFDRTGQPPDLDEAITVWREAVAGTPTDHPDRRARLSNLGIALQARFDRAEQLADVDEAITVLREAVAGTPTDQPGRPIILSNLGVALGTRFDRTGQLADVDEAITVGREAVGGTPTGQANRPTLLSNLGGPLLARYWRTTQHADLDEAITVLREAVAGTPSDHPDRGKWLCNIGIALWARYERYGQPTDLDEAITVLREAVAGTPADHASRPTTLSGFVVALGTRFDRTGQLADVDEAITVGREAVADTPTDHASRPKSLTNLGIALSARFERLGQQADLDEAITVLREAVAGTPLDHPKRAMYLSNLGTVLQAGFDRTEQPDDVDEVIAVFREAVAGTPTDHPDRPRRLSNLGGALRSRFDRTGQLADVDEAITVRREAVAGTPTDHPKRAMYLSNLGMVLHARYERSGQPADLNEAITVVREGTRVVTAPPQDRLAAAWQWGIWAVEAGDPNDGLEGYAVAVEQLLPMVVWHGLDEPTREHHLETFRGLATRAAACAVAASDPYRAVEMLEAGRSVLWTQALRLRGDLSRLAGQAPDLAVALERARAVLDNFVPNGGGRAELSGGAADVDEGRAVERAALDERRQAARDWDRALQRARELEGFERFLQPMPFSELHRAATAGPVVILNVTNLGCHALIVTDRPDSHSGSGVRVLELPAVTFNAGVDHANVLLIAQRTVMDPVSLFQEREAARAAVFDVLAWLWEAITGPVLEALGYTGTPDGPIEDWPRVWWCPTGPLTVLPLHAAGRHPRTLPQRDAMGEAAAVRDSVAGRVVSSYTPTLTTLIRFRDQTITKPVRQLAIGVPDAPGQIPLPGVPMELQVLTSHLPPPDRATHLLGPAATRDAVLDALPSHSWLHLSCHGVQDPFEASRSAFLLHDEPLTLADLAAINLQEAELAYLAACQTATGHLRLFDEALHLAAALNLAGYRHVLATLWNISDAAAPAMADTVYAHLTAGGHFDAARAAYALHHAVIILRQALPGEPLLWAPYIHLGP